MLRKMRFLLPNAAAAPRHAQSLNLQLFYRNRIHFRGTHFRVTEMKFVDFPDFPFRLVSIENTQREERAARIIPWNNSLET